MAVKRLAMGVIVAAGLAGLPGCVGENQASAPAAAAIKKGGDERNGGYLAPANWWKPAPEHTGQCATQVVCNDGWGWGEVSGLVADSPNRIIVAVWGDRGYGSEDGGRPNSTNYMVEVDGEGNLIKRWAQYDTMMNTPHQVYINPYDPERHIWLVERGGNNGRYDIHEQIFEFTNDGGRIVNRLIDPKVVGSQSEDRQVTKPGPFDYGQASVMTFLPNGDMLVGDGYWNGRIIRYNAKGEYISEFGSVGNGPGQFDLIHGIAVDREHRIYVADRQNNRVQVFTETGEFIEEWPDITNPAGIYMDENENVWVVSATLNRLSKYNKNGEYLYSFGAYGGTRGGFAGGLSRPHQITVDSDGNLYVASWDGGWANKFTPAPGHDPNKVIGKELVLQK